MKQQVVQIVYIFCFLLSAKELVDCKQQTCPENQYVIIDAHGRKSCLTCNDCPSGRGLSPPCGSELYHPANIDCVPCTENTYSDEYGPSSCKSCGICSPHEIVNKNCTASENTNCSKACVRGYYYDTTTHGCQPCSECCGNDEGIRIEECKKHDMPLSKQCSVHQSQNCEKRESTTTSSSGGLQPNTHDSRQKTALILAPVITGALIVVIITIIILIKRVRASGRFRGVQRRRRGDLEEIAMIGNSSAAPTECLDMTNPMQCILKTTIGEAPNVEKLKKRLKILLDPPKPLGGDIRSLADAFGYTSNKIDFLFTNPLNGSPTEALLRDQGHQSIKYLLEKLVDIKREEAAGKLREYIKSQNCNCERCKRS